MGRKRLKGRPKNPTTLGVNLMAQITYRGVKYNAEQYKAKVLAEQDQRRNHKTMYRGIKVDHKFASSTRSWKHYKSSVESPSPV